MSDFTPLTRVHINDKSDVVLSTFNDRETHEKKYYLNVHFVKADGSAGYSKGLILSKDIIAQLGEALKTVKLD